MRSVRCVDGSCSPGHFRSCCSTGRGTARIVSRLRSRGRRSSVTPWSIMGNAWFEGSGNGGAVDVAELLDGLGSQGIRELVEAGALVSIGTTRDGGALAITVTVDG